MERNPYTRTLFPERVNDDEGRWLYFVCSKCRKLIDAGENDTELLKSLFIEHLQSFHPRGEDFSQAAARIVREATERD